MSKPPANPSELARETLKTLATRKVPPTPDNYAQIYAEIGGLTDVQGNGARKVLLDIAESLSLAPQSASVGAALKQAITT
ncbi:MAG: hypothetical protein HYZ46_06205 [Nitrosomonadales bacterium]|nr:hypothetical protein [Nitrosomonadales bacterium]